VTHSAISHHIKALEDGIAPGAVSSAPAGRWRLRPEDRTPNSSPGPERLPPSDRGRDTSARLTWADPLTSRASSTGPKWLVPRLLRFPLESPDIEVRCSAT